MARSPVRIVCLKPWWPWTAAMCGGIAVMVLALVAAGWEYSDHGGGRVATIIEALGFATAGAVVFMLGFRRRERWRSRPGECARCGYDLRGTTLERCSECGAPIDRSRARRRLSPFRHG